MVYGTGNTESWHTELDLSAKATSKEYMGLAAFVIGFGFLIWGASSQGWWFGQFSAVFFWIAVVTGAIYGYSLNQWAGYFVDGMKDMVSGAVAVGFAKAISVILADGVIIDTVVYYLAKPLEVLPGMITSAGMMVVQTIINLGVPSGSAQGSNYADCSTSFGLAWGVPADCRICFSVRRRDQQLPDSHLHLNDYLSGRVQTAI